MDRVVCLGDIVGYNARPAECIALIRDSKALCVAGNHDLAVCGRITTKNFSTTAARAAAWTRRRLTGDELAFLRGLPLKANIDDKLILVHGALHPETGCESERLDNARARMASFAALMAHPSGARICAFGHTHRAGVYEWRNGEETLRSEREIRLRDDAYYLINPGTVGEPRIRDRRASYMILDLGASHRDASPRRIRRIGTVYSPRARPDLRQGLGVKVAKPIARYRSIRSRLAVIRAMTRRNEVSSRAATPCSASSVMLRATPSNSWRSRFAFAVRNTRTLRRSSSLRTRRINPDRSMLRSAITVVGSIMPTRADNSRCDSSVRVP